MAKKQRRPTPRCATTSMAGRRGRSFTTSPPAAPLVAKARASKDEAGAKLVGGQALTLALALGSVLSLVLLIFREPLLHVMGTGITGAEADHYGVQFLTVRALAAPAVLVCSASNGILRGYLDTKTPTIILLG